MKVVTFLVPDSNSVTEIPTGEHVLAIQELEASLANIAGGFTKTPGREGAWKAPDGRIIRDLVTEYRVATIDVNAVKFAVLEAGRQLKQHSMYVEVAQQVSAEILVVNQVAA